jgi:hypothetical protein
MRNWRALAAFHWTGQAPTSLHPRTCSPPGDGTSEAALSHSPPASSVSTTTATSTRSPAAEHGTTRHDTTPTTNHTTRRLMMFVCE